MSLPTNIILPSRDNYQGDDDRYMGDLIFALQGMYEDLSGNINGYIRNNADIEQSKWIPTLNGTTSGTCTYTQQIGWSIRQGIYTHVFFDISWTATTAAGNLYLELPYKVTLSNGMPFVGVLQPSSIVYAGFTNLVINAIPDTYRGEVWKTGSGAPTANLAIPASGRLSGHLMYIGLEGD